MATAAAQLLTSWTVRAGQTLSAIAAARYGQQNAWPLIYWANRHQIRWADQIYAGQVLRLPAWTGHIPAAPAQTSPPQPAATTVAATSQRDSDSESTTTYHAHRHAYRAARSGSYSVGGSFQACVIARESGGSVQVMNSSGHWGLYQFSSTAGAAYGGSPGSFGNASAAYQTQIFNNAMQTSAGAYITTLDSPPPTASPGGFPLVEGGKIIGAVGCSGATGDQDAVACKAGADTVK